MYRPVTPQILLRKPRQHDTTPTKAAVLAAVDFKTQTWCYSVIFEPKAWQHIRFSDEAHFCWGPEGAIRVIQKLKQRYYHDCIQERPKPEEKDKKRIHCWAAVGHDFKSDIYFYDSGNLNWKIKQVVYINRILDPVVKLWLKAGHDFLL